MEDEIFSPTSSSSDLSGSTSTEEPLDVFYPESEIPEDPGTDYTDCGWGTEKVPPDFQATLSNADWDDVTDKTENVWDKVTDDTDTEKTGPDIYETLSPEEKQIYDLLPNHGGLGRDPNDPREY